MPKRVTGLLVVAMAGIMGWAGEGLARADYITYTFSFSGTITSVDDATVYLGNTIHLLPDVVVGAPFQGTGVFDVLPNGRSIADSFLSASGSNLGFTHVSVGSPLSGYNPATNSLLLSVAADFLNTVPAHVAVVPTQAPYDYVSFYNLFLSPGGSSLSIQLHHFSMRVRTGLGVAVSIDSFSIVPEPGGVVLLGVGLSMVHVGCGLTRHRPSRATVTTATTIHMNDR